MEETNQEVTLKQLLEIAVDQLGGIQVPAAYAESIALPISRVIGNLKVGITAIDNASVEMAKQQENAEPLILEPEEEKHE